MSTDTEHSSAEHSDTGHGNGDDHHDVAHGHADEHEHGLTDKGYVGVALILALMTAAEVALSYIELPGWFFMTALLTLMVIKFVTVVSFFMHLKFDNKLFSWLFYAGLILAVCVYLAALTTFQFFAPG